MSELEWPHSRCILCLHKGAMTREHVIPAQLGGPLWVRFLCQGCNSRLGATIEVAVREDPSVRLAVERLEGQLPGLADAIRDGLPFTGKSKGGSVRIIRKKGKLHVQGGMRPDGQLILPPHHARHHLAAETSRRALSPEVAAEKLNQLDELPENISIELLPGYWVSNWRIDDIRPALDGPGLSDRALLKIAFEFLACHTPHSIYGDGEQLENIRSALLAKTDPWIRVEHLTSRKYQPLHGLALEADEGHAVVHICLFGWIHYRVHLLAICTQPPFFAYTCDLAEGTEHCDILHPCAS